MFPEHQLKVYYPYGGKHFILRWHSHNEGNHLIIAKSKDAAEHTFSLVLKEHSDVTVKDFLQINIVAPTDEQCKLHEARCIEMYVSLFWQHYSFIANEYRDTNGKLPSSLKECLNYSSKYEEYDDYDKERHNFCINCCNKIMPTSGTMKEIYLANREQFLQNNSTNYNHKTKQSIAPKADQSKIEVVKGSFGHHSIGVDFAEDTLVFEDILFFYQNSEIIDTKIVNEMIQETEETLKQDRSNHDKKWDDRIKKEQSKRFDDLLKVFK